MKILGIKTELNLPDFRISQVTHYVIFNSYINFD